MKFIASMVVALCSIVGMHASCATAVSQQYTHDFWAPKFHGKRLNYCSSTKALCGQKVADRYCQMQGYDRAQRATIDYNLGVTRYLDNDNCCVGWACSGFKLIQCSAQTLHSPRRDYYYRTKKFVMPRFNHYRIDWCYANGQQCGKKAAFSFCRRVGYMKAVHYHSAKGLAATRALGNQQLCFGNDCQGFASITCYR